MAYTWGKTRNGRCPSSDGFTGYVGEGREIRPTVLEATISQSHSCLFRITFSQRVFAAGKQGGFVQRKWFFANLGTMKYEPSSYALNP
jgi:hypothetical protein